MRYSLVNRFQGTLFGVSLGNLLGIESLKASIQQDSPGNGVDDQLTPLTQQNQRDKSSFLEQRQRDLEETRCPIGGLKALTQSFIQHQGWPQGDLLEDFGLKFSSGGQNRNALYGDSGRGKVCNSTAPESHQVLTSSEAALIAIPAILLFHEETIQRHDRLEELARIFWEDQLAVQGEGMLIVAEAIAQALTETLHPRQFASKALINLPLNTAYATLLTTVQGLIEHRVSLAPAVEELIKTEKTQLTPENSLDLTDRLPLVLALYCFLSTPEDPKLSMLRAVQTGYSPEITTALCGALSGAYNGKGSFPIQWQMAASSSQYLLTPNSLAVARRRESLREGRRSANPVQDRRLTTHDSRQDLLISNPKSKIQNPKSPRQPSTVNHQQTQVISAGEALSFATDLFAIWSGVYRRPWV